MNKRFAGAALGVALLGISYHAPIAAASSPIQHIVVIYQENHSFDNVLGNWCDLLDQTQPGKCIGMPSSITVKSTTGKPVVVTPTQAPDMVPGLAHNVHAQATAIDGGRMDGWAQVPGCSKSSGYQCLTYYTPSQIPNITALASTFAVSDMTFSEADSPSWGGHLYAVAATTDGFIGDNPTATTSKNGPGWGCDSYKTSAWLNPATNTLQQEPSCIPDPSLSNPNGGAFEPTPVSYVPTIMDRLDAASLSWRFYTTPTPDKNVPPGGQGSYKWATCPTIAECLDTSQRANMVPTDNILADAQNGTLPNYSLVLPSPWTDPTSGGASQHNGTSMAVGDNWIGKLMSALEAGPEWSSTAVFLTWDDCGCFYDQVPPGVNPDGSPEGVRVPLIIASPYVIPGFVDSTPTTFAGILAYVEQTFGLPPLSANDAAAYPFTNAFDYSLPPTRTAPMRQTPVSAAQRAEGANETDDAT